MISFHSTYSQYPPYVIHPTPNEAHQARLRSNVLKAIWAVPSLMVQEQQPAKQHKKNHSHSLQDQVEATTMSSNHVCIVREFLPPNAFLEACKCSPDKEEWATFDLNDPTPSMLRHISSRLDSMPVTQPLLLTKPNEANFVRMQHSSGAHCGLLQKLQLDRCSCIIGLHQISGLAGLCMVLEQPRLLISKK